MMRNERKDELAKEEIVKVVPIDGNNQIAVIDKILADYLRVADLGWARTIAIATVVDVMGIRVKYNGEKNPSKQSGLELDILNAIESQLRVVLEIKGKIKSPNEMIDKMIDEIRKQRNRLSNLEGKLSEILSTAEIILIAQKEIFYRLSEKGKNFLALSASKSEFKKMVLDDSKGKALFFRNECVNQLLNYSFRHDQAISSDELALTWKMVQRVISIRKIYESNKIFSLSNFKFGISKEKDNYMMFIENHMVKLLREHNNIRVIADLLSNKLDEVMESIKQQEKQSKLTRGIIAIKSFFGIQHQGALERELKNVKTEIQAIKYKASPMSVFAARAVAVGRDKDGACSYMQSSLGEALPDSQRSSLPAK